MSDLMSKGATAIVVLEGAAREGVVLEDDAIDARAA